MSAHVEVWLCGSQWIWLCSRLACDGRWREKPAGRHPTHAEALQAALDHCARYPIKDRP